ncbi:MAG: hypothetical protein WCF28_03895 [Methanobacterium sp.]
MNNEELNNEDIPQNDEKSGSNPFILVGIIIFLIIVIIIGAIVRTGSLP